MNLRPLAFASKQDDMSKLEPAQIMVVKPGWFTTVQDLGRYGLQHYGVPVSGAMDRFACTVANRLVGNRDRDALLEMTLNGPELLFEKNAMISLTGADLTPSVDGAGIPLWTAVLVKAGSRLRFGARKTGTRCYLALAGGIDVPLVLGSRATHVSSKTGGVHGRALTKGDRLLGGNPSPHAQAMIGRSLSERLRPSYDKRAMLRIIPGPQESYFQEQSLMTLTASPYTITAQSNRMGYRLAGPPLARKDTGQFVSDGTTIGALQVASDEQPILLMADSQTTGGYPKIGVVISADLPLAAQLAPGDTLTFKAITVREAQDILKTQRAELDNILLPVDE